MQESKHILPDTSTGVEIHPRKPFALSVCIILPQRFDTEFKH